MCGNTRVSIWTMRCANGTTKWKPGCSTRGSTLPKVVMTPDVAAWTVLDEVNRPTMTSTATMNATGTP